MEKAEQQATTVQVRDNCTEETEVVDYTASFQDIFGSPETAVTEVARALGFLISEDPEGCESLTGKLQERGVKAIVISG